MIDVNEITDKLANIVELNNNEFFKTAKKLAELLNEDLFYHFREEGIRENFIPLSDDEDDIDILEENYHELIGHNWDE